MKPLPLPFLIALALLAAGCGQPETMGEKGARISLGMDRSDVLNILGPHINDERGTNGDARCRWIDDDFIAVVSFKNDKVIECSIGPNKAPLKERYKTLRLGDSEAEAKRKVGQPDSADYSGSRKQWYYWEGADPNCRTLEICFVDGRLVSRRFGLSYVLWRPDPWDKRWTPLSDPPFPAKGSQ